jgi:Cof subfamily protein (haloacid dehalogenase superfamily)
MSIKAVFVDMDGTILGDSQVAISKRNMEALQKALKMGIHVIPCTGRVLNMLPPQLLTQEGMRYFVTCHGARIYDKVSNETIYEDTIPAEQSAALMKILEGRDLYNEIAADGTLYYEKSVTEPFDMKTVPEHHVWYLKDRHYKTCEKPSKDFITEKVCVEKMNLYNIPEEDQKSLYDALLATGYIQYTACCDGKNLELQHKGMNKIKGVTLLLERLGITFEETMALGDSMNDYTIIQKSGMGVAMGNGVAELKAIADDITATNVEDGFALALEKHIFSTT